MGIEQIKKKPDYTSHSVHMKVEDMLLENMRFLFAAMHVRDGPSFDETLDFVEDLLMYEEDSYKEFIEYKELLSKAFRFKWGDAQEKAQEYPDTPKRTRTLKQNKIKLQWQFRRDCLRYLVHIFFKRQILQYRRTTYATLEGIDDAQWNKQNKI
jgi:hypothetical protein